MHAVITDLATGVRKYSGNINDGAVQCTAIRSLSMIGMDESDKATCFCRIA